jgi:hypothetical protein
LNNWISIQTEKPATKTAEPMAEISEMMAIVTLP